MQLLFRFRLYFSILILIIIFFGCLLSFFVLPHDFNTISLDDRFLGAGSLYWLGTDQLGRDFYSRLLVGTRNSFIISSIALIIGSFIGISLGLLSVSNFIFTKQGLISKFITQLNQLLFAFPVIFIAILFSAIYGAGGWYSLLAISIFNIPIFYSLTKNISSSICNKDYFLFSLALGSSQFTIYRLHFFPQLYASLLAQFTIQLGFAILMEASLSYLGLGIQAPTPSLGRIIYESQTFFYFRESLVIIPGIIIILFVLATNHLGEYLSYHLNPKN